MDNRERVARVELAAAFRSAARLARPSVYRNALKAFLRLSAFFVQPGLSPSPGSFLYHERHEGIEDPEDS